MVNSWRVQQAARAIRAGAVIAYPTEAVWGLGCDPWDEEAVDRLLLIKGRSVDKGLILVADNIRQFDFLFEDFPELWMDRMASTWPGPNTWLVPHQNMLPEWITGVHETVALRVSDHPQVRDLCALVGPLVSTSAGRRRVRGFASSSNSGVRLTWCWAGTWVGARIRVLFGIWRPGMLCARIKTEARPSPAG